MEDRKCEICGSEKNVERVGCKSYWCKSCIERGLAEANKMNEIELCTDEVEQWLGDSNRDKINMSIIQRNFKWGLIKTNMVLEQLVKRNIISFNESLRMYEVIGRQNSFFIVFCFVLHF